ncbi:serum paraoxonase/arylesterase family protein [Coniochaeta ligniaria NRRL 30616]|uniref:Serum paraoxonase/arylesterase family protein n=1 Tax=Coniochaeta ligniaria NRRL 30616 TaxID=1408157 RepID=A0A1J7IU42_9PEZI|nr:serum paraoxonase/arylesterase family protein [Coniochaeta ligniaria NRRL 30616]
MATARIKTTTVLVGLLSVLLAGPTIYNADLPRTVRVLGMFRQPANTAIVETSNFVVIADTPHCEDLHFHAPNNLLFTACEGNEETRFSWFPPLVNFDDPSVTLKSRGAIHVIDPKTMKAQRLALEDFDGPFVTHGIDVISDPEKPAGEAVYIFAVNHVPNPAYYGDALSGTPPAAGSDTAKSRSRVEIFRHEIGSASVRHIRSVWDPLIRTPNDIVALSPTSFLVTNDHIYREGLMRTVEDMYFGAKWTDTIHVTLNALGSATSDTEGVVATVALDKMHNNNGLGHGRTADEVLVVECISGILNLGRFVSNETKTSTIRIEDFVKFDSPIDNPSYYADPFADSRHDASSYVAPGLGRAVDLHKAVRDSSGKEPVPVMIWSAKTAPSGDSSSRKWETRLLFEDDGSRIRSASAAVQVAIDPAEEGGDKRAWLFVTGFIAENIIAVKVDV